MIEDQKAIARLPLIGAGGDARCQYLQIADQRLAAERALHDAAMNAMLVEVEQHQAATEELGDQGFPRRILKQVAAILEHELIGIRAEQGRSEEHTSDLQSLMRISYAVFCLKKKQIRAKQPT